MAKANATAFRILVVEDEYVLAEHLRERLREAGAFVLGPVSSLQKAIDLIRAEPNIDGAILDVSLGGETVYPAADLLIERAVPFVLTSGYPISMIPHRFSSAEKYQKPISARLVVQAFMRSMQRAYPEDGCV